MKFENHYYTSNIICQKGYNFKKNYNLLKKIKRIQNLLEIQHNKN